MWKTVSEDCNLSCDYCYYSTCGGKAKGKNRIDPDLLRRFIQQYMSETNGIASFVWQGGEPLLAGFDFFQEVVTLQAEFAPPHTIISNAIQTNATLINEQWARFFKKHRFLVGVSLDGPEEINDRRRVTGTGVGSYRQVMRGIEHLRKEGVEFNILTVVHEGNIDRAAELVRFYKQEDFKNIQFLPCMDFRAQQVDKPGVYTITPEQYGKFLCEAFDVWYENGEPKLSIRMFDNMLRVQLNYESEFCVHRETCPKTLVIERNGDAYPCDFYIDDRYKIGNVGVDSLADILNHDNFNTFVNRKKQLPESCSTCQYLKYCHGGCPRNRMWDGENAIETDYFCTSYQMFYSYTEDRMLQIADKVKSFRIERYKEKHKKMPDRNANCICGSGKKFKRCCQLGRRLG
ncbi:anaerobic sulfatase maturase [Peribacillus muralis]|nr:anaerobic sulfatase maturase [Peribacillus muralis]